MAVRPATVGRPEAERRVVAPVFGGAGPTDWRHHALGRRDDRRNRARRLGHALSGRTADATATPDAAATSGRSYRLATTAEGAGSQDPPRRAGRPAGGRRRRPPAGSGPPPPAGRSRPGATTARSTTRPPAGLFTASRSNSLSERRPHQEQLNTMTSLAVAAGDLDRLGHPGRAG